MMIFLKRALQTGTTLVIFLIILLSILWWLLMCDPSRISPKLVNSCHGFFPLYETNFVKTVVLNQPNLLWFSIRIETLTPFDTNLSDVILKIEAIKNDQVLGSQTIQGDIFKRWGGDNLEPKLTNHFGVVRINQKYNAVPKNSLDHFKYQEQGCYRITVVQPCEKYESARTKLWAMKCN